MEQQGSGEGQLSASQSDYDESARSDVDSDMVDASAQREAALRDQVATLQQLLGHLQQQQQQQQQRRSPDRSQPQQQSRFAKKEPRANDLREYDGAAGVKLDEWIRELRSVTRLFELSEVEAVKFGVSRLRGAAQLWWDALEEAGELVINDPKELAAALRQRFQPVTAERVAREELDRLRQANRHINDYIADFQRICSHCPDMANKEALHAFERGLRPDIAEKLRIQGVDTVASAIAIAARIGGLTPSSTINPHGRPVATANQMNIDSNGATDIQRIVNDAVINALRTQPGFGGQHDRDDGAATNNRSGSGNSNGGRLQRGGRPFGGRSARPPPSIPGVPASVVQQRWDSKQCLRCGAADHLALSCPNAISAYGQGN